MTDQARTAASLFREFYPRFHEISWKPCDFKIHNPSSQFHFSPDERTGYTWYDLPHLDICENELDCTFIYDHKKERSPTLQFKDAVWKAIVEGPFAGRTFYADPDEDVIDEVFEAAIAMKSHSVPVVFSYDGDPIPGLVFVKNLSAKDWTFFIPPSPERNAIVAAIQLERARQREHEQKSEKPKPTVDDLQKNLDAALGAIAA